MSTDFFSLIELDGPVPPKAAAPKCKHCGTVGPVDEQMVCFKCYSQQLAYVAKAPDPSPLTDTGTVKDALTGIAAESSANAATAPIPDRNRSVGFTSRAGYIEALRRGTTPATYQSYIHTLRTTYGMTTADINALNLPGPGIVVPPPAPVPSGMIEATVVASTNPATVGQTVHIPAGPSIFDRPKAERSFVVAPKETAVADAKNLLGKELIAGSIAAGHHAVVAWVGSSNMTRGALVAALTKIGHADWAPEANSARLQASNAIGVLGRAGLHIKAARKTNSTAALASGIHEWSVGRVDHAGQVGEHYGTAIVRFRLVGETLTYTGDATIAEPVLADYRARMAAETMGSSDVTSWLQGLLWERFRGVRFGAMGYLIPSRHVTAARQLCEAVRDAGFGRHWETGLPVVSSDQLRASIARSLTQEVQDLLARMADERAKAAEAAAKPVTVPAGVRVAPLKMASGPRGDIGAKRVATFGAELKTITERLAAYTAILGEEHTTTTRNLVRDAQIEIDLVVGSDYEGSLARFDALWEGLAEEAARKGEVL